MSGTYLESRIQTFDDFRDTESMAIAGSISPYQYTDFKEKDKLEWLNQFFDYSLNTGEARFRTYRKNMYLYKGVHWKGESSNARSPKQSVNFIAEMTEAKIASRAAKKVNFTTVPVDDDQLSVNAAKGSKLLLDARCKQIDFDALNIDLDRVAIQQGHAFFHVSWNPHAGGVHPTFEKIEELGGKTLDKIKKKIGTDRVFIGDVDVNVIGANQVMPEPKKKRLHADVDYVDIVELVHVEELKSKYPNIEIEEAEIGDCSWTLDEDQDNTGYAVVHTFYHRKTPALPNGVMIKWTRTAILEESELPFRHGMIPLVDDKDITVTGEFFGRSCYMNVYNLQRFYNLIQTGQARNFSIGNVPKWVYPKGSVNPNAINNEFVALEYSGAVPPQLVSNQNLGETGFNLQDRIEAKIAKQMGVYSMQRGDVPQGITANSALRFIDEQESKRDSTGIASRNQRIIKALNMIMDTMAQYYKAGDGRAIRALGEDNEYLIKNLSKVDFTKVYKVDIQKTSALSDTKAGRISDIIDLNQVTQTDPVFKRDEIIEMLDLGVDRAFKRRSAVGINAARAMLDMILEGQEVPEPQMYDSLVVHYKVFTDALEEDRYKNRFPQDIQLKLAERVKTIEGLMYIKATQNIKFAQEVAALEKYPIFFTLPMPIHTIIMQASQPVQQALPAANTSEFEINQTEEMTNGR